MDCPGQTAVGIAQTQEARAFRAGAVVVDQNGGQSRSLAGNSRPGRVALCPLEGQEVDFSGYRTAG